MAVVAAVVNCAAGDWTQIAFGVSKIAGVFPRSNPNLQTFIIPTTTNVKPAAKVDTQPWVGMTGIQNSVLNDDGSTYWWLWTDVACSVVVWKV